MRASQKCNVLFKNAFLKTKLLLGFFNDFVQQNATWEGIWSLLIAARRLVMLIANDSLSKRRPLKAVIVSLIRTLLNNEQCLTQNLQSWVSF